MSRPLQSLWWINIALSLGPFLHCGDARVHTEVPAGLLYRVVGSPLSISCNVSGFTNESTVKEFEFRMTHPTELNIISTANEGFSYSNYKKRVRSGDISVKHVSPNSVVFEIKSLQKNDDGEYDCSVVNSEGLYDGVYSARTTVKVIDNSLTVSSPDSTSLTFLEGDAITLTCQASSNTIQHTHLSLAWYLLQNEPQLIISLDRDFTLSPGGGFEDRYKSGFVRLDKMGEATYKLKISQLELSDQGKIYCQAQEWILDPDRSWYSITQKDAEETTLNVRPREVVSDKPSVGVRISAQTRTLQEGQGLSLSCNIDMQNLEDRFFSVAWLRGGAELAGIGPTGVLSVGQEYRTRAEEGELRAARIGDRDYRLILQRVRSGDQGEYICRVWPEDRGQDGGFARGAAEDSNVEQVSISPTDSFMKVKLLSRNNIVTVGENVELICQVRGLHVGLAVTLSWSLQRDASSLDNILTVSSDGAISWSGEQHRYQLRVENKGSEVIHYLLINGASHREAGRYQCSASVFLENAHKQLPPSNQLAVNVQDPVSTLILTSTTAFTSNINTDVQIKCSVTSELSASSRYAVTWLLQQQAGNKTIVSSDRDAFITFGVQVERSDRERISTKRTKGPCFELGIKQAQISDQGSYTCELVEWVQDPRGDWYHLPAVSKTTKVTVIEPEKQLSISKEEITFNVSTSHNFTIPCHITTQSSTVSAFQVVWLWQEEAESEKRPIFASYRNSTLQMFWKGDRLRFSHPLPNRFSLTVLTPGPEDSGLYFCQVEEWLSSLSHGWRKAAEEKSGYVTVNVYADGDSKATHEPQCISGAWIWILLAIIICTLLAISVLMLKICQSRGGNKAKQTLWAEQHPLNTKPSADL